MQYQWSCISNSVLTYLYLSLLIDAWLKHTLLYFTLYCNSFMPCPFSYTSLTILSGYYSLNYLIIHLNYLIIILFWGRLTISTWHGFLTAIGNYTAISPYYFWYHSILQLQRFLIHTLSKCFSRLEASDKVCSLPPLLYFCQLLAPCNISWSLFL
jgi:hypothetical protein